MDHFQSCLEVHPPTNLPTQPPHLYTRLSEVKNGEEIIAQLSPVSMDLINADQKIF